MSGLSSGGCSPTLRKLTLVDCPCPHKRRFPNLDEALAHADRLRDERGTILRSYECECAQWHLTSQLHSAKTVNDYLDWLHVGRFVDGLVKADLDTPEVVTRL